MMRDSFMNFTAVFFTRSCFFLCISFMLSSCAEKVTYRIPPLRPAVPELSEPKIADTAEADDPDLQLVKTEPEVCLDQELVALSKTGLWSIKDEPVTLAPIRDDTSYDFPIVRNKQVDMYLDRFQNSQRK
jgi:hypothetical protein